MLVALSFLHIAASILMASGWILDHYLILRMKKKRDLNVGGDPGDTFVAHEQRLRDLPARLRPRV